MNKQFQLFLKAMSMGIAEVIPGVSGGTLAFITGIYERLLQSISQVISVASLKELRRGQFSSFWKRIDGSFLLTVVIGMVSGIAFGVVVVTTLLKRYPPVVWAFFFGLIIGSSIYIAKRIRHWEATKILGLICGAAFAWYLTSLPVYQGNTDLWFVFVSGAIAISALVLPGISGSFMLLILGMYLYIIDENLKGLFSAPDFRKLLVMFSFAAGALTGLVTVVRALNYLLNKYHEIMLAVLTGFMLGSLHKIWPWRNVIVWLNKNSMEITRGPLEPHIPFKVIQTQNVWPDNYEGSAMLLPSLLAMGIGLIVVFLIEYALEKTSGERT